MNKLASGEEPDETDQASETENMSLAQLLVHNSRAVLGPEAEHKQAWRENLLQIKSHVAQGTDQEWVALVDAIVALLDADGDPTGLGTDLHGESALIWQELLKFVHLK